jgi:hypothetical protein
MKRILQVLQRVRTADAFSPTAFVSRAAILSLAYAVSCLAGLQEYTAFLSGTFAVGMRWQTSAALGLVHLLLHFAFIVLVPILLITAGLLAGWNVWKTKGAPSEMLKGDEAKSLRF